jgi:hypothetical protein
MKDMQCALLQFQLSIKMTTKIKYAHDHYDLCVNGWIKCLADNQIDNSLYNLSI